MRAIIDTIFLVLRRVEEFVLATAMLLLAGGTIVNVLSRTIFNHSLSSLGEINQFLIIIVTFVGLSYAVGRGRHIRMTALYDLLPHKGRKAMRMLITLSTALLLGLLAWHAARYALGVGSRSPVLDMPLKWVYLVAPFGLGLGAVQYLLAFARNCISPGIYLSFQRKDEYEEAGDNVGI